MVRGGTTTSVLCYLSQHPETIESWREGYPHYKAYLDRLEEQRQEFLKINGSDYCTPKSPRRKLHKRSPIILDMDGDGCEITSLEESEVFFDMDGDGFSELTEWVSPDDALLVIDSNQNGQIDDVGELFGNDEYPEGYTKLRTYDENSDNVIDCNDAVYESLMVWRDNDADGIVDEGELQSLSEAGIASLSLDVDETDLTSTFTWADGTVAQTQDVFFTVEESQTIYSGDFEFDEEAFLLPSVIGYGNVADLNISMSLDEDLKAFVQELSTLDDSSDLYSKMGDFLAMWAQVEDVDPEALRGAFSARELAVIEKFMGTEFYMYNNGTLTENVVDQGTASELEEVYGSIKDKVYAELALQTVFSDTIENACIENEKVKHLSGDEILKYFSSDFDITDDSEPMKAFLTYLSTRGTFTTEEDSVEENSVITFVSNHGYYQLPKETLIGVIADIANQLTFEKIFFAKIVRDVSGDTHINFPSLEESLTAETVYVFNNLEKINTLEKFIVGTGEDDNISGTRAAEFFYGFEGNDTFDAGPGDDWIYGGAGRDVVCAGDCDDVVFGGAGKDRLDGGYGDDFLSGDDGDDTHRGGYEDDTLDGGGGNDMLYGGQGNDIYVYNLGDGRHTIFDEHRSSKTYNGGMDTLRLGKGIDVDKVVFFRDGNDLIVGIVGSSGMVTIKKWFQPCYQVEEVKLSDGHYLTGDDIKQLVQRMTSYAAEAGLSLNTINDVYSHRALMTMIANAWE